MTTIHHVARLWAIGIALLVNQASCFGSIEAEVCTLSNAQSCVQVSLTGGRITSWRDAAGRELLFMPKKAVSGGTEWSHGGIPLCWPWFGRKDGVIHGFIRTKRLAVVQKSTDSLVMRYSLAANEEPAFPQRADVVVEVSIKEGLKVSVETVNKGDKAFEFTCGIHPYFGVSDYGKLSFDGIGQAPFACVHGMDKAFSRPSGGKFNMTDAASSRVLSFAAEGNSHVILWTPGTEEPPNRNLKPEDMTKFVGYGPAHTKASGPIVLRPGESHKISFRAFVR